MCCTVSSDETKNWYKCPNYSESTGIRAPRSRRRAVPDYFGGATTMNLEKVIFGFFIVLALTVNVAFVSGEFDNPAHHNV